MLETLDLVRHNPNSISIQDLGKDLNISDAKWDFVFEHLLKDTTAIYFKGYRLWLKKDGLFELVDSLSEKFLFNKKDYLIILFRVKPNAVYINRAMLDIMWEYYEYPELVFVKTKTDEEEEKLIEICDHFPLKNDNTTEALNGVFCIRRGGESDVLWIEKSNDMTFPWETTRSPLAIEKEANRPWYERLLNNMGIFWTIKINRKR